MNRRDTIEHILREAFTPSQLEVVDFSAEHAGHAGAPAGGESHFRVHIAAAALDGQSRLAAHRTIYKALGNLMQEIHALQINVIT